MKLNSSLSSGAIALLIINSILLYSNIKREQRIGALTSLIIQHERKAGDLDSGSKLLEFSLVGADTRRCRLSVVCVPGVNDYLIREFGIVEAVNRLEKQYGQCVVTYCYDSTGKNRSELMRGAKRFINKDSDMADQLESLSHGWPMLLVLDSNGRIQNVIRSSDHSPYEMKIIYGSLESLLQVLHD